MYIHSEYGHVVLAFEGELSFLPRIIIPNYVDAPARDIAEHMIALWNENMSKKTMSELPNKIKEKDE